MRTVLDGAMHPSWWVNFLTTEPLRFATPRPLGRHRRRDDERALRPHHDAWPTSTGCARTWDGPLVVKGIQTVEDARAVVDHGADAIVLSNHGGRQLDRAPVPVRLVPEVREALGPDAEIMVDTGVMSGADVVAAIALGASSVLVGRAYLYGLMAGGEAGCRAGGGDPVDGGAPHHAAARRAHASRTSARSTCGSPPFRSLPTMAPPHLVALDVDGTTINHAGVLSAAVREAVRDVVDAGHHVIISTGRSILATREILDALGIARRVRRVLQRCGHPRAGPGRAAGVPRSSRP